MTASSVTGGLAPLPERPVQPYFCNNLQIADIIEWTVAQCGRSVLTVSTFSAGEEFLRRLWRLRHSGAVTGCTIICDTRALMKTRLLLTLMSNVADSVLVASNHSKVVLVDGASLSAAIVTSQNLTRGNRMEAGMIIADPDVVSEIRCAMQTLITNSTLIHGTD